MKDYGPFPTLFRYAGFENGFLPSDPQVSSGPRPNRALQEEQKQARHPQCRKNRAIRFPSLEDQVCLAKSLRQLLKTHRKAAEFRDSLYKVKYIWRIVELK